MQKSSCDSSIINYVHSLPVISTGKGEEFDFFVSNDVAGILWIFWKYYQIVGVIHSLSLI